MQYCPKCKISIRGNKKCCPLCQSTLVGEPEDPAFPVIKRSKVTRFSIIRLSAFIFLVFEILMLVTYYLADHALERRISWIPIVMISAVVCWLNIVIAFYLRNNIIKIITYEAYIIMIFDYIIDLKTGFYGWSVNWMIPCTFLGLAVVTICIGKGEHLLLADYMIYLISDSLLCMLQLIPMFLLEQNTFEWPAVICMTIYVILAVAALLFRPHEVKNASAKCFNL